MWIVSAALVLLIVVALSGAFIAFPVPRFPDPDGPFRIGTHTYHWVDVSRPEPFSTDPNDKRELVVQVWYPAEAAKDSPVVAYIDHHEVIDTWAGDDRVAS